MKKLWHAPKNEGFMVFVRNGFNAIVPQTDIKPHDIESALCHCNPTSEFAKEDDTLHILHNSFRDKEAMKISLEKIGIEPKEENL